MSEPIASVLERLGKMGVTEILDLLKREGIKSTASRDELIFDGAIRCGCPLAVYLRKMTGLPCLVGNRDIEVCKDHVFYEHTMPDSVHTARIYLDFHVDSDYWSKDA